jgi:hypothetical protein
MYPPARIPPPFRNGCGFSEDVSWNKRSVKEIVKQNNLASNTNEL